MSGAATGGAAELPTEVSHSVQRHDVPWGPEPHMNIVLSSTSVGDIHTCSMGPVRLETKTHFNPKGRSTASQSN
jgi:hypothetical protein